MLTHFNEKGEAIMVDVSEKAVSGRLAVAKGFIKTTSQVMSQIQNQQVKKGDVLSVARIAGIMAVKKTADLIPLCHPLFISNCQIDFNIHEAASSIEVICTVKTTQQTGVEMEALTGVNVALLTIYDMCKAVDKKMEMNNIHLAYKSGGKSGVFINEP